MNYTRNIFLALGLLCAVPYVGAMQDWRATLHKSAAIAKQHPWTSGLGVAALLGGSAYAANAKGIRTSVNTTAARIKQASGSKLDTYNKEGISCADVLKAGLLVGGIAAAYKSAPVIAQTSMWQRITQAVRKAVPVKNTVSQKAKALWQNFDNSSKTRKAVIGAGAVATVAGASWAGYKAYQAYTAKPVVIAGSAKAELFEKFKVTVTEEQYKTQGVNVEQLLKDAQVKPGVMNELANATFRNNLSATQRYLYIDYLNA